MRRDAAISLPTAAGAVRVDNSTSETVPPGNLTGVGKNPQAPVDLSALDGRSSGFLPIEERLLLDGAAVHRFVDPVISAR